MATVTPNFNWPVPVSTDLVKDGATAIEALGDSIDASFVDLKGGTTGQVLSKASNTDLDFTWVTNADGDITGVTAGTGLTGGGTSGAVTLAVDPTYAGFTNLNYLANPVLNSSMNVWQRGTSFSLTTPGGFGTYTADRWVTFNNSANVTISRQATNDTTNLPNIQYCSRVQRNSGQTGTGTFFYLNQFETINSVPYAGKTVTFSFYARAGANYSATSNILNATLNTGTGTDQNAFTGYTGNANPINASPVLTTTWQRFSYTATLATNVSELYLGFYYNGVGTAGANDYYEVTGVQLDIGSVALPFRTNGPTYAAELAACRRYFQLLSPSDAFQDVLPGASCDQTAFCRYPYAFQTIMRTTPTCSSTGTAGDYGNLVAAGFAGASAAPSFTNIRNTGVTINLYSASITTGQGTCLRNSTSFPSQWLTFSAEL